jgi:cobalt-zinc-cadmium efflux system outer membrane protein
LNQRYQLIAGIRQAYFDVLTLNQRIGILNGLVSLAEQSVATTQQLVKAQQLAPLDVVQLEVELGRLRVERDSAQKELPAALRRLATAVGVPTLALPGIIGTLDVPFPDYELDRVQAYVLSVHPEVKSAVIGVDKARLILRRAEVQPIPNVTVGAGYVRQNQNQSNDWTIGVSVPVPVWNRNQGNIQAARAALAEANKEIARVENDLADRVATAMREFAAAKQRVESLKSLREKAGQALSIVREAKTTTTLQRLESQRSLSQVDLEFNRALGELWKAASVISGLALEDQWPPAAAVPH